MLGQLKKWFLLWSYLAVVTCAKPKRLQIGSRENPGKSCKDILANGGTLSKNYFITVGGRILQVFCDQTTDGGGWTLVYSYTFVIVDIKSFNFGKNAVTPRPSWPIPGNSRVSTTPPQSETDYNAMNFALWQDLGSETLLKSNINNWYACTDRTGSITRMRTGTLNCRLVKNNMGVCDHIVPNAIQKFIGGYLPGPNIFKHDLDTPRFRAIYYLNQDTEDDGWPSHDPCGQDILHKLNVDTPRGNFYLR